jgi:hypothetical protein
MSRGRLLAAFVAAVAVAGVAAIVVVALAPRVGSPLPPPAEGVTYTAAITPARQVFGDRAVAELTVVVDTLVISPESVQLSPRFSPFQRVGPIEVERADHGETSVLRFRYPLQCIERACAPGGDRKTIELPLALVRVGRRDRGVVSDTVVWPAVTIVSRLEPAELLDPRLEVQPRELPAVTFVLGPTFLGWLLAGAAAALVLAVGTAVALRVRRIAPSLATDAETDDDEASAVETALALVEAAVAQSPEDRRTALDELARRLDEAGLLDPARTARRLAWSHPLPSGEQMGELVAVVRRAVGEAA